MLFNSIDFAIFLPIVFTVYWFILKKNLRLQNLWLLTASYVFYGWWDYRFLGLIVLSTLVDFIVGIKLEQTDSKKKRKVLLWISILTNIGLLGFFKYYNFFVESFTQAFSLMGYEIKPNQLHIILPVGISFYTFQTMSYSLDVYFKKMRATHNLINFASYVSFFPQLVAGPIERAKHLLPQIEKKRVFNFDEASDGMRQILWGLFKKVVIADNLAVYSDAIFNGSEYYSGSTLLLGAVLFAFQIYGDFSGYSDIAIGTARLFGIKLMQNFKLPYFSRDIAEFWRRWHISLSTWFRDYIYIPLGGSRTSRIKIIRNTFIIFLVSGFWHGANWTFLVWGGIHALLFLPLILFKSNRKNIEIVASDRYLPSLKDTLKILGTFLLTTLAWIFFRSNNIEQSFDILSKIFSPGLFERPHFWGSIGMQINTYLLLIFILIEWIGRREEHPLARVRQIKSRTIRFLLYSLIIFFIAMFMQTTESPFIYFQF